LNRRAAAARKLGRAARESLTFSSRGMPLLGQIARLPLKLIAPGRPRRVLTGALRGATWIPASGPHGCWLGIYERGAQRLLRSLVRAGDVVFDIGANVGFYALLAARLSGPNGRVIAFEPLASNVAYLCRHLELNCLENVEILQLALSDENGRGFIAESAGPSMSTLASEGVPVEVARLDDLVDSGRIPTPQVLKIDVEGAESRVLQGARLTLARHRPKIILAAHGWRQGNACSRALRELGYTTSQLRDGAVDGNYSIFAS